MKNYNWQFPRNPNRKRTGFKNPGVTHFTGDRFRNVIRETSQNSLDAVDDVDKPVTISIRQEELSIDLFAGKSLLKTVNDCIRSTKSPNDKPILGRISQQLGKAIEKGTIPTLVISDSNTTGATDVPKSADDTSMWEALTNSDGINVKSRQDSAGSYGIGKNAPFNISLPRTVLYSTTFQSGRSHKSLLIGRSLLVSHRDIEETDYGHEGYLGDRDFASLENEAIPDHFRRSEPGLTIYIVGLNVGDDTNWRTLATATAITDFFHGIVKGKVVFDIDNQTLHSGNILDVVKGLSDDLIQTEIVNFIELSAQTQKASTHIDHIGTVNLYLKIYEDPDYNEREIALVRDAGMLITNELSRMNLEGMKREGSVPRNWRGFTTIVECLSENAASVLREAESTSHDEILLDNIEDMNRRRLAERQLRNMAKWIKKTLEEHAKPAIDSRTSSADELNEYIALKGEESNSQNGIDSGQDIFITTPKEVEGGVSPGFTRRGRRRKIIKIDPRGEDNEETTQTNGKRNKRRRRKRQNRTVKNEPNAITGLRMIRNDEDSTHTIIAIFDSPQEVLRGVKLVTVGEDGYEQVVGLKGSARVNDKKVRVRNDAISTVKPEDGQSRTKIRFETREPVVRDGHILKSFYLKQESAKK